MAAFFRRFNGFKASFLIASAALAAGGLVSRSWADELSPQATRDWSPLMVGGWQLSPTFFAGAIYNSNVDQNPITPDASWGERIVPGITAHLNNGIYTTDVYGVADITNYANSDVTTKTAVDAKAGFTQVYAPAPDLTFRLGGDYTRQADVFGTSALAAINTFQPSTPGAPSTPTIISPLANAGRYNQFSGTFSVDKSFGRTFVGLTASAVKTIFDSNSMLPTTPDGTVYTITERTGFNLTPQIYAFVDPSVDWQRYSDATRNSNGYRVTAGVGTLAVGIWKGEVFGGYQTEKNDTTGTYNSPVFGFRVGYSPTPIWNFQASVDETLGAATAAAGATTTSAARVATALANVEYKGLPQDWTTSARIGFVRTQYVGFARTDNGWLAGANVRYEFWRNLGITLDYQYKSVESDVALQSFSQHLISLGASYKY